MPTPEVVDEYRGAEILLPRGDEMVRCDVVAWSHDANGKVWVEPMQILFGYYIVSGRLCWEQGYRINHQCHGRIIEHLV